MTLERRRTLGELLADTIVLYARNWRTYLVIAAAVIVPVDLIVMGIGLGQLGAPYPDTPSLGAVLLGGSVSFLVTMPLLTAMVIAALRDQRPSSRRAIQFGLDLFAPALLAIVLAAVAIVAGCLLIVPGIYLAVRLHFVVQAVAIDERRGMEALRRSWELTAASFWRVLGLTVLFTLVEWLLAGVVSAPFDAIARSADAYGIALVGAMIGEIIVAPAVIIATTLLYFDLRDRVAVRTAG